MSARFRWRQRLAIPEYVAVYARVFRACGVVLSRFYQKLLTVPGTVIVKRKYLSLGQVLSNVKVAFYSIHGSDAAWAGARTENQRCRCAAQRRLKHEVD